MKADKKEYSELRAKVISQVQEMVTSAEFTAKMSNLGSDTTQRLLDLRSEVFTRTAELNQQTLQAVAQKAN